MCFSNQNQILLNNNVNSYNQALIAFSNQIVFPITNRASNLSCFEINNFLASIYQDHQNSIITQNNQNSYSMIFSNDKNIRKRSKIMFKKEEDERIIQLVNKFGTRSWTLNASFFVGKSPKQCRDRYSNYLAPGFFYGEWSNDEDELLKKLIKDIGPKWSILKKFFKGRTGISIKNRWNYFLSKQNNQNENSETDDESKNNKNNDDAIVSYDNVLFYDDSNSFIFNDNDDFLLPNFYE